MKNNLFATFFIVVAIALIAATNGIAGKLKQNTFRDLNGDRHIILQDADGDGAIDRPFLIRYYFNWEHTLEETEEITSQFEGSSLLNLTTFIVIPYAAESYNVRQWAAKRRNRVIVLDQGKAQEIFGSPSRQIFPWLVCDLFTPWGKHWRSRSRYASDYEDLKSTLIHLFRDFITENEKLFDAKQLCILLQWLDEIDADFDDESLYFFNKTLGLQLFSKIFQGRELTSSVSPTLSSDTQEMVDEAARALRKAVRFRPQAKLHNALGIVCFLNGAHPDAADAFEQAISLVPSDPVFRRNLMRVQGKTLNNDKLPRWPGVLLVFAAGGMSSKAYINLGWTSEKTAAEDALKHAKLIPNKAEDQAVFDQHWMAYRIARERQTMLQISTVNMVSDSMMFFLPLNRPGWKKLMTRAWMLKSAAFATSAAYYKWNQAPEIERQLASAETPDARLAFEAELETNRIRTRYLLGNTISSLLVTGILMFYGDSSSPTEIPLYSNLEKLPALTLNLPNLVDRDWVLRLHFPLSTK